MKIEVQEVNESNDSINLVFPGDKITDQDIYMK